MALFTDKAVMVLTNSGYTLYIICSLLLIHSLVGFKGWHGTLILQFSSESLYDAVVVHGDGGGGTNEPWCTDIQSPSF